MKNTTNFLIVGLLLATSACSPSASSGGTLKGEITISGAFALYPLVMLWTKEFQNTNPGVKFDIATGGSGKGMEDVLTQNVDIGMISREITPTEEELGAYPLAVAKDAVFVLVNSDNPVITDLLLQGLKRDTLVNIFITGEIKTWGEAVDRPEITDEIHVYTRSDTCGAAATWSLYLGGSQSDLLGKGELGDPGMIQAVQKDPLGIGYNNLIYAYGLGNAPPEGTLILPLDLNANGQADPYEILDTLERAANAVTTELYPSRTLYLVTNGKPSSLVQAFLEWALTDGQAYLVRCGHVQLPAEQLELVIQKIH